MRANHDSQTLMCECRADNHRRLNFAVVTFLQKERPGAVVKGALVGRFHCERRWARVERFARRVGTADCAGGGEGSAVGSVLADSIFGATVGSDELLAARIPAGGGGPR